MTDHAGDLRPLIAPQSIAVVGASDSPERIGGRILARLKESYQGIIQAVNPTRSSVQGLHAFPSISATDNPADLAIVATPAAGVVDVARECATRGVKAMLILSAGFAETGDEGRRRQDDLLSVTVPAGIRVCGPNCIGLVNLTIGLRAVFTSIQYVPQNIGNIAIVSQSGAFGMTLYELAQRSGLGASYFYAAGNQADVSCGEALSYFVEQPDVKTVGLFIEGVSKPETLIAAGRRAMELGKTIVGIKVGRSAAGTRAAASHTGALTVPSTVIDAVFDDIGIVRVENPRELIDYLTVFAGDRAPSGRRLAIVTSSGGVGVMMADAAASVKLKVHETRPALRAQLQAVIPDFGSAANPVDVTAQVVNDQSKVLAVLNALTNSPDYDILCVAGAPRGLGGQLLDTYEKSYLSTSKPFVVYGSQPDVNLKLMERGIPVVSDPVVTIKAIGALCDHHERRRLILSQRPAGQRMSHGDGSLPPQDRTIGERESRSIVERYGVAFPRQEVARSAEAAVAAAERIAGPVVLKLSADWMPHKSEHGAVLVGLRGEAEVTSGFRRLADIAERVGPAGIVPDILVQQMIPAGLELACGAFRDPAFGPMVSIGLGGVLVEILAESRLGLVPVSEPTAERLLSGVAGGRLLSGPRGLPAAAVRSLVRTICGLSRLMEDEANIREVDLNPLIVDGERVIAVDALVVTSASG
jgi:acyl-CoA synthetase (NDP forming)